MNGEVNQTKIEAGKISPLLFLPGLTLPAPKNYRWVPEDDVKRGCLIDKVWISCFYRVHHTSRRGKDSYSAELYTGSLRTEV